MSSTPIPLGGRLPLADYNALSAHQQRFFDEMTSTVVPWAGASAFLAQDGEGRFIGPFNPALLHPELGKSFLELQYVEVNHSVLTARTREVIILTVGSVWQADYELYAHSAVAGHAGLPEDVVISLVEGETPDGLQPDELIAHRVARQLTVERRIDDSLYRVAEEGSATKACSTSSFWWASTRRCAGCSTPSRSPLPARSAVKAAGAQPGSLTTLMSEPQETAPLSR